MEIERKALVPDVPKDILFYAIELIGEGLIEDAEENFGDMPNFNAEINLDKVSGEPWRISYSVDFSVYHYEFIWELKESKKGILVMLVGRTPKHWWSSLFDMETKLENLVDTQWSAFTNFAIGYMTAVSVSRSKGKTKKAREHVRGAKKRMGKTSKRKKSE
uniref:Uncharacterized protein n=1 Tax=uncultured euryarchaeote Alv-FOS5 TaxID=337891 RepID=Q3SB99_9EURY|nr:hypothetical protein [uncultured euryarchaeote Alv-FOS5]